MRAVDDGSSVPGGDRDIRGTIIGPVNDREGQLRILRWVTSRAPVVTLLLVVAGSAVGLHHRGITWGDDWTLYLRQAKSLFEGNIGDVIADNHFNVDHAAKPGFSPNVYPWGFPIVIAPAVRLFGFDYARLKLVEVGSLCIFLWFFHEVARRRMNRWAALGVVAVVGTSLAYLRHTDFLLSEFPYMASAAITLWWLDRIRRDHLLHAATRTQLVALGLMAVWVFNVRREGIAMIAAIAVAQVLDLRRLRGRWHTVDRLKVATPLVTFVVGVTLFQLLLPSTLAPEYSDSGLHQTWRKITGPFTSTFADQLGYPDWHGGRLWLVFLLAVTGLLVRLWKAPGLDAPLAVYAVGSLVVVGMIPAEADRYLLAVTPFAVYFAAQALSAVPLPRPGRWRCSPWLAVVFLAIVTIDHASELPSQLEQVRRFNDGGGLLDGPEQPYAVAGFQAVLTYTHEDDVVAFFKARSMTFHTDRRAVQSSPLDPVRKRADYFLMRRASTYSQPLVSESEGLAMDWEIVWQDNTWVLWRLPLY